WNGVTVAETSSQTVEEYDRQGRLYQITEPSGAQGADVTTTYSYDVGNRLAKVETTAEEVAESVSAVGPVRYLNFGVGSHPQPG
ncbi:MAG: RHS repeat protein, partial [bacterium]|nr:RHS repeat protein [bacterium]